MLLYNIINSIKLVGLLKIIKLVFCFGEVMRYIYIYFLGGKKRNYNVM